MVNTNLVSTYYKWNDTSKYNTYFFSIEQETFIWIFENVIFFEKVLNKCLQLCMSVYSYFNLLTKQLFETEVGLCTKWTATTILDTLVRMDILSWGLYWFKTIIYWGYFIVGDVFSYCCLNHVIIYYMIPLGGLWLYVIVYFITL